LNAIHLGYDSTNYYAIPCGKKYLLIDAGMPGTLGKMKSQWRRYGIDAGDIRHLMVTHFHPDHCGIAQELQSMGIDLIVGRTQSEYADLANKSMAKLPGFREIVLKPHNLLDENDKFAFEKRIGIPGYILHTPGHSDDSISIVIEGLGVFTGDLPPWGLMSMESNEEAERSWSLIRSTNERRAFPGHGDSFELPA